MPVVEIAGKKIDVNEEGFLTQYDQWSEEIAKELYLGLRTIEGIRSDLIQRVGAKNAIGLILYAQKYIIPTA